MSVFKRRDDDTTSIPNCNKSSLATVPLPVKKSPTSYGIPRFTCSQPPKPSHRFNNSHLRCLPRGLLPSGFPTENFETFLFPISAMCPANLILLDLIIQVLSREQHHDTKREVLGANAFSCLWLFVALQSKITVSFPIHALPQNTRTHTHTHTQATCPPDISGCHSTRSLLHAAADPGNCFMGRRACVE
jgi:hypothetical protein